MARVTKKFSVEQLEEEDLIWYGSASVKLHETLDKHRWYTDVRVVFEHEDQLWEIYYMDPATEMQEGQDRFHSDPVEATLVEEYTKTITAYRHVDR